MIRRAHLAILLAVVTASMLALLITTPAAACKVFVSTGGFNICI